MKITSIRAGFGETRTANFQAVYAEAWLEAELESDEDPDKAYVALENRCRSLVESSFDRADERRVQALLAKRGEEPE